MKHVLVFMVLAVSLAALVAGCGGSGGGGSSNPPPPPPPPPTERQVVVTANLNVRSGPSGLAKDIGTLKEGTDITVVEESGDWLKLKEGWIHGGYTKEG